MSSRALLAIIVIFCSFVIVPTSFGQAVSVAEVSGNITDQSGSAIEGAQISMVETTKQFSRPTVSDIAGRYVLPSLPVGPYRLEVKKSGFKDYIQNGIVLIVNNNIQINVVM